MKLIVHLYGREIGHLIEENNEISFSYNQDYLNQKNGSQNHALSVTMPLTKKVHQGSPVNSFFAGLLPESPQHRKRLAQELGLIYNPSDYILLSKLGRDCAGAITILPENEVKTEHTLGYLILSETKLAENIKHLPHKPLFVNENNGVYLSLAGVNDKAAVLMFKKNNEPEIALAINNHPTTHIIKTDIPNLPHSIRVEQFCSSLAKLCGHKVPDSKIITVEDQVIMIMSRYDRSYSVTDNENKIQRLHQEDFCQALGYLPSQKYERHKGPDWKQCFDLMSQTDNENASKEELLKRAIFQYLVGNTDAHAKNYALLYRSDGSKKLSPFYDLNNSFAFHQDFKSVKPLLAMSVGGEFNLDKITLDHWKQFALDTNLFEDMVLSVISDKANIILKNIDNLRNEAIGKAGDTYRLDIAVEDIKKRANFIKKSLDEHYVASLPKP